MSCEDISNFVSTLNICTFSCFEVKTKFDGSRYYRLCIKFEDREKLLDASIFPKGIIVRDWVWKPKLTPRQDNGSISENGHI